MKRRDVLVGAGLAAGGAALAAFVALGGKPRRATATLGNRFRVPGSAVAIGRRYLDDHPAERDAEALRRAVLPEAGFVALQARMAADLDAGRTTTVGGWILSVSEARLYALLALESGD